MFRSGLVSDLIYILTLPYVQLYTLVSSEIDNTVQVHQMLDIGILPTNNKP